MKNYLIIPAMPTPNGPLHLGHIGGPYLRADMLARHLRQGGNKVKVVSGTDNFENYTERQSIKENKSPELICNTYYPQIVDDLKTMNIELDAFINLHDERWLEKYKKWCFKLIQNASQMGMLHHKNEDLVLDLPKNSDLNERGINDVLIKAYGSHLKKTGYKSILTSKSSWGVRLSDRRTLLSYGFIYAYYLMLAEIETDNALFSKNDTTVIASFGIDNTFSVLDSVLGYSSISAAFKPVDYYIVNYFYHMQGKKFSTSSRHAVWVSDIKNNPAISIDIVRLYLAGIDVNHQVGDYSSSEFSKFHSAIQNHIASLIRKPIKFSNSPHEMHAKVLLAIDKALQPNHFKPHIVANMIKDWIKMGTLINPGSAEYDAWLKTFGCITYAIMPNVSKKIQQLIAGDYDEAI